MASGDAATTRPAFIDTPDACYQVERQMGESVYLKAVGSCEGKPGRAFITSKLDTVKIFVEGLLWKEMKAQSLSIPDVEVSLKKAEELGTSITIPTNASEIKMKEAAERTNVVYQSPEFQGRLKAEAERIKLALFGDAVEQYYPDSGNPAPIQGKLGADERIYVFVSSSMPIQTIRNYAKSTASNESFGGVARFDDDRRGSADGFGQSSAVSGTILSFDLLSARPNSAGSLLSRCPGAGPMGINRGLLQRHKGGQYRPDSVAERLSQFR